MTSTKRFPTDLPDKIVSISDITQDIGRWSNVEWIDVVESVERGEYAQVDCMVVKTVDGTKWRATWEWNGGWAIGKLVRNETMIRQPRPQGRNQDIEKY